MSQQGLSKRTLLYRILCNPFGKTISDSISQSGRVLCERPCRDVKSAKLNGKAYQHSFNTHADITAGGTLELEMGNKPNQNWGIK